ncbi:MAG: response regulator [Cyclobacteriaceae bacterium]
MSTPRTKILIVEDDFVVSKNLVVTLEEREYDVLGTVESGEELLECLKNTETDLVIMDINLAGQIDGVQTTGKLRTNHNVPVLYLTADRDPHTLERAKLTNPDGYLIKPFDSDELVSAIEIAIHRHQLESGNKRDDTVINDDHLFVRVKNRLEKVKFDDILLIEANDIYATLITGSRKYILSYSLKTLQEKISSSVLMRVHRSFMININHIDAIEDNYIIIQNHNVPIGKTYKDDLMKRLSIS